MSLSTYLGYLQLSKLYYSPKLLLSASLAPSKDCVGAKGRRGEGEGLERINCIMGLGAQALARGEGRLDPFKGVESPFPPDHKA